MGAAFQSLDRIFNARSLAVVGASSEPGKLGYMTLNSIITGGFEGHIYPVNPKGGEILGLEVYKSLLEIPDKTDLAVIIVPAALVPQVLRDAVTKNIPGAVILTAGFKEAGRADLEDAIQEIARQGGLRFVGPNVQGINYLPNKLCAMFFPVITTRGPLTVISQSGSVTSAISEWSVDDELGITAAVNLGNQADIGESEYLAYFGGNKETKTIAMYLEGLSNGRRFLETIASVSAEKPVVILKSGQSEAGKKAVASHTGSLAGDHQIFNAAMKQSGAIVARDQTDLYDRAKGGSLIKAPRGNRVLSISTSGGMGALAADEAEAQGLVFPPLPDELCTALKNGVVSPLANMTNPLDLGYTDVGTFRQAALLVDQHNCADVILLNFGDPMSCAVEVVGQLADELKASMAVSYCGGGVDERNDRKRLHRAGVAVFPSPERAIRGIAAAVEYADFRQKEIPRQVLLPSFTYRDPAGARYLLEPEAVLELSEYGVAYPEHALVGSAQEAATIADQMGYPVVLKVVSPDVLHKTDAGGVAIGVRTREAVISNYHSLISRVKGNIPGADIRGVLVCRQVGGGHEVIIGGLDDPVFGPTVMLGSGGVFAEILKDITFRIAPFGLLEAQAMITEIKSYPVLMGARGGIAGDLNALAELLTNVSNLMFERPGIKELDLNPVRVFESGIAVLDVRLVAEPAKSHKNE